MALFKYPQVLEKSVDQVFDILYAPGTLAPLSGIYRCQECGKEETSIKGYPLPPQNHHQHSIAQGPIRWRLVVTHR
jgi:hypothetical protein